MKTMKAKKVGSIAIKLDIFKSYDIVELTYLSAVIGFNNKWIELIMKCVIIVSYAILVNGQPRKVINPSRG